MTENKHLVVSECFYSIQGEGQTMGVPAVFLRLAGCNLLCKSKTWICDSIEVWQKGNKINYEDVLIDHVSNLREGVHLVITGGEPLLHQNNIAKFLKWFSQKYGFRPIVEIETNGTIIPAEYILQHVDYWNCSPKLSNSGETHERRINNIALRVLNNKHINSIFKFVVSSRSDVLELLNEFPNIDYKRIVLMPAGATQEELNITRPLVMEECKRLRLRYSDRLHIVAWNKKTGV